MVGTRQVPRRLYKYRAFSNLTLNMLVADNLFFADPSTFNDPLDTRPAVKTDLSEDELERILVQLVESRLQAEMTAAARTIKYRGPRTIEHIAHLSKRHADDLISDIKYHASDPEFDTPDRLQYLLGLSVAEELLRQYEKGIVSFGERANCVLMWSHYGDQHKGICIGYSVPSDAASNLYKVNYGGTRLVEASAIAAMLAGDDTARRKVDKAVLLKKAIDWRYEREWRLIGERGLQNSNLELEEVVFGVRCDSAVKYAVVKALEDRERPIKFYEMQERPTTFGLSRVELDTGELTSHFPRRFRSLIEGFKPIDNPA
jgi:hypothetical protein